MEKNDFKDNKIIDSVSITSLIFIPFLVINISSQLFALITFSGTVVIIRDIFYKNLIISNLSNEINNKIYKE